MRISDSYHTADDQATMGRNRIDEIDLTRQELYEVNDVYVLQPRNDAMFSPDDFVFLLF